MSRKRRGNMRQIRCRVVSVAAAAAIVVSTAACSSRSSRSSGSRLVAQPRKRKNLLPLWLLLLDWGDRRSRRRHSRRDVRACRLCSRSSNCSLPLSLHRRLQLRRSRLLRQFPLHLLQLLLQVRHIAGALVGQKRATNLLCGKLAVPILVGCVDDVDHERVDRFEIHAGADEDGAHGGVELEAVEQPVAVLVARGKVGQNLLDLIVHQLGLHRVDLVLSCARRSGSGGDCRRCCCCCCWMQS